MPRAAARIPVMIAWGVIAAWILLNIAILGLGLWDYRDAMEDWPGWGAIGLGLAKGVAEVVLPALLFIWVYTKFVLRRSA